MYKKTKTIIAVLCLFFAAQPTTTMHAWALPTCFTRCTRSITNNPKFSGSIAVLSGLAIGLAATCYKLYQTCKRYKMTQSELQQQNEEYSQTNPEQHEKHSTLQEKHKQRLAQHNKIIKKYRKVRKEHNNLKQQLIPSQEALARQRKYNINPFDSDEYTYQKSPQKEYEQLEKDGFSCEVLHPENTEHKDDEQSDGEQKDSSPAPPTNGYIEKTFTIAPPQKKYEAPLHLFIIHGTFSTTKNFGGSEESILTPAYKVFGMQLAHATARPVHIHVFSWSGKLDRTQREEAGQNLARIIRTQKEQYPKSSFWVYAHSHGCNVTVHAAQELKKEEYNIEDKDISINTAIFLASPAFDVNPSETDDGKLNIFSTTMIWGDKDLTGTLGSLQTTWSTTLRKNHATDKNEFVRNIRLKLNNNCLNHIDIKHVVIRFLASILAYTRQTFPLNYELVYNITNTPNSTEQPRSEEKNATEIQEEPTKNYYIQGAISPQDRLEMLFTQGAQVTRTFPQNILDIYTTARTTSADNIRTNPDLLTKPKEAWGYSVTSWWNEVFTKLAGEAKYIANLFDTSTEQVTENIKQDAPEKKDDQTALEEEQKQEIEKLELVVRKQQAQGWFTWMPSLPFLNYVNASPQEAQEPKE